MDEKAPPLPSQEVKHGCSSWDVSIPTSSQTQTNTLPFKNQFDRDMQLIMEYFGYIGHEIFDSLHVEHSSEGICRVQHIVEQVNVLETTHENFPESPFSYQQGNEGA